MPEESLVLADSVTRLDNNTAAGKVVVTGSHGGIYAAYLARQSLCRAAIFNDAGVGLDRAGIGGLAWLALQGMAAAAIDHASANIGDAAQMLAHGQVSHVNTVAQSLGVLPGMSCAAAADVMITADAPTKPCPEIREGREILRPQGAVRDLILVDSAGLVRPDDAGQVIATGSHGALFGGNPANALKTEAFLALFNDAGGGAGTSRLPALDQRGIAAVTVAAASARIGDARSTWEDGLISAINTAAQRLGAQVGTPARELVYKAIKAPR
ncbi:hypothetical protein U5922_015535 [Aquicoccus sp. G2-2]|uniref:hypothetical protein n=1 Tax=Aquicoccus sp. G2-2 TaxID=3092120 RepID=UPI002ADF534E|nr:hypothetical protein [Aquicoccus sp. G2-2]MEA1114801.1 hypothetical protein [Aquicoccus sp. G2-2]